MNIQTITKILIDAGIEPNEAKIEMQILLKKFGNYTTKNQIMGDVPDERTLAIIEQKVQERIRTRIPIQYLTEEAYFMGEIFKVSPDVLIPRDETELLVRYAIDFINKKKYQTVLDIGTGSGCIACALAKNTKATVLGVDISSDALRIALDNVTKLGINNRAVFRKSNLFEKIRKDEKFDVIISNPPYIPYDFELSPELKHEPIIALRAAENGLEFYKKIVQKAPEFLKINGMLMFELGIGESGYVLELMKKNFCNITVKKDLAGIERVIFGEMK